MPRNDRLIDVLLGALIIFLLVVPTAYGAELADYEATAQGLRLAMDSLDARVPSAIDFDAAVGRDPLDQLVDQRGRVISPVGLHDNFSIQGVCCDPQDKIVLIDGEFYREGDVVGTSTIVKIRSDGFVMNDGVADVFVPLYPTLENEDSEESQESEASKETA